MVLFGRLQRFSRSDRVRIQFLEAFRRSSATKQFADRCLATNHGIRYIYSPAQGETLLQSVEKAEYSANGEVKQRAFYAVPRKTGPGTLSKSLVKKVMALSDVKEDVYEALDEWAAFELEFPVVATRMALEKLRKQEQWHRIIQITKWMFNKGLGKTHGSYLLLLKAYCMEGRLTEAEDLWNGLLVSQNRSMPKSLFAFMTNVYRRHGMPEKVTQVFEQMEGFGIKPDIDILRRAEEAYQQLNMKDEVEQLGKKYSKNSRTRRKEKRLKERKENLTLEHGKVSNGKEQEFDGVYQTDEDEEDAQRHVIEASSDTSNKSSGIEEPVGLKRSQKGRRPEHVLTVVESEFLKQVLDTMR